MTGLLSDVSPATLQVAIFALVSTSVAGLLLATLARRPGHAQLESRVEAIAGPQKRDSRGGVSEESRRRRLVEETLREIAATQSVKAQKRSKPTLVTRMRQAGVSWSRNTYVVISGIVGFVVFLIVLGGAGLGVFPALGFGLTAGLLLPHLYLAKRRSSRLKRFAQEFPNAVDVIVRGVKSGFPLVDCLKIVATDAQEPVRGEFKAVVDDQTLGVPLDESVGRLADRVPLPEANFFAIVVAIQSRTGGSLSETLGNLSKVVRDRKTLKEKIKAMSAEAKTSAGIIGAMPIAVSLLLYLISPEYIEILFYTTPGNVTIAGSVIWMLIGTMVMRQMINFDF